MILSEQRKILQISQFPLKTLKSGLFLGVGSEISAACAVYLQALLFIELFTDRDIFFITLLIGFMMLNHLLSPILDLLRSKAHSRAGLIFKSNLRNAFMQEIISLGPLRLEQMRLGRVQAMMTDGVESLEPYIIKYFSQVLITALSALAFFVALALIDVQIALILLFLGISVVAIPRLWDKALGVKGHEHWSAYAAMNEEFLDNMAGITTLKAFGAGKRRITKLDEAGKRLLDSTLAQLRLGLSETGLSAAASALGPIIALGMAAYGFIQGTKELWELFVIVLLARRFFAPFSRLSALWHESFFGLSALGNIVSFFENSTYSSSNIKAQATSGNISFENVDYCYANTTTRALTNISLNIHEGQTVAITGRSGSGKSTMLALLMGFDTPRTGTVRIGGTKASEIDLSQSICLVPQNALIFQGSVRDILQAANPSADEQVMLEALDVACALDLGQRESSPLELFIEPKGANLSGGQCQRLALARALMRNTPILLLDEATSALDSNTEQKILKAIQRTRPELTLIMVTHRLEIAQKADKRFFLANGYLEEQ